MSNLFLLRKFHVDTCVVFFKISLSSWVSSPKNNLSAPSGILAVTFWGWSHGWILSFCTSFFFFFSTLGSLGDTALLCITVKPATKCMLTVCLLLSVLWTAALFNSAHIPECETSSFPLHFLCPVLVGISAENKYSQLEMGDTHGTVCLAIMTKRHLLDCSLRKKTHFWVVVRGDFFYINAAVGPAGL